MRKKIITTVLIVCLLVGVMVAIQFISKLQSGQEGRQDKEMMTLEISDDDEVMEGVTEDSIEETSKETVEEIYEESETDENADVGESEIPFEGDVENDCSDQEPSEDIGEVELPEVPIQ